MVSSYCILQIVIINITVNFGTVLFCYTMFILLLHILHNTHYTHYTGALKLFVKWELKQVGSCANTFLVRNIVNTKHVFNDQ